MNDFHLKEKLEDSDVKSLQIRLNTKIEEITGSNDEDEMMAVRTFLFLHSLFKFEKKRRRRRFREKINHRNMLW